MVEYECDVCGEDFETSQALGSHRRYKHGEGGGDDSLDLKEDLKRILKDVGLRKRGATITDIFFDLGADNIQNLEYVLRKAGVTNPAKALILMRWGQRIDEEPSEELLKGEERRGRHVFEAYDRIMEAEMRELLMEDLRARIDRRRGEKQKGTDESKGLKDKLDEILFELKWRETERRPLRKRRRPPRGRLRARDCQDPLHPLDCVVCGNCGYHGSIDRILLGETFVCPRCGPGYVRDHY